nr:hypothetical protein [Micromonospora sp. DSM 115978]
MHNLDEVLAVADREWRSMGVVWQDRTALADDLRRELEGAAADGIAPGQLLGDDIRQFARDLAFEAGANRLSYENRRLLLTALAGAAPGLVLGWAFTVIVPNALYLGVLASFAGALLAVKVRMREVAAIDRTLRAAALLMPAAGLAVTPMVMAFALVFGFSTALPIVLIELALVGGALGAALVLARRWALAPVLGAARPPVPAGHR